MITSTLRCIVGTPLFAWYVSHVGHRNRHESGRSVSLYLCLGEAYSFSGTRMHIEAVALPLVIRAADVAPPVQIKYNGEEKTTVWNVALTSKREKTKRRKTKTLGSRKYEARQRGGNDCFRWGARNVNLTGKRACYWQMYLTGYRCSRHTFLSKDSSLFSLRRSSIVLDVSIL